MFKICMFFCYFNGDNDDVSDQIRGPNVHIGPLTPSFLMKITNTTHKTPKITIAMSLTQLVVPMCSTFTTSFLQ